MGTTHDDHSARHRKATARSLGKITALTLDTFTSQSSKTKHRCQTLTTNGQPRQLLEARKGNTQETNDNKFRITKRAKQIASRCPVDCESCRRREARLKHRRGFRISKAQR